MTQELLEAREHITILQEELNQAIDRKSHAERELKACMDDLTAANIENDKLHAELKRSVNETKALQGRIGDLRRWGHMSEHHSSPFPDPSGAVR